MDEPLTALRAPFYTADRDQSNLNDFRLTHGELKFGHLFLICLVWSLSAFINELIELARKGIVHWWNEGAAILELPSVGGCFAALSIGAYGHIFRESEAWALHRAQALLGLVMLVMWSSTLTRVVFSVLPGLGPQMLIFQRMVVDVGKCTSAGLYYDRLALLLAAWLLATCNLQFATCCVRWPMYLRRTAPLSLFRSAPHGR